MDLTYEASNGIYLAPIQMQANNGLLVIDDFGRQTVSPETLLNRWIVPLDRRVDYLSLSYGVRFDIPFDVKVVFSTNLDPTTLGDEAFYRRIQNKILVSSISDAEFDEVLMRSADDAPASRWPRAAPATCARSAATWATATCGRTCPRRCARSSGRCAPTTRRPWCSTRRPWTGWRRSTSPGPARSAPPWPRPPPPTPRARTCRRPPRPRPGPPLLLPAPAPAAQATPPLPQRPF